MNVKTGESMEKNIFLKSKVEIKEFDLENGVKGNF